MQISPVRFSQPQNKPAFGAKAFIHSSDAPKLTKEITAIADTEIGKDKEYSLACPRSNGVVVFAPDAHMAKIMIELSNRSKITSSPDVVVKELLNADNKLPTFCEK